MEIIIGKYGGSASFQAVTPSGRGKLFHGVCRGTSPTPQESATSAVPAPMG